MMSSIYSGVSGLKAQQKKLDVIGNNIANVNTAGFKGSTVSFADVLSQTLSGASAGNGTTGGTNAKQIGLGVGVAATTTSMTTGSTQSTGNSSDVSISGSGFFIVEGGSSGKYQFTRAGNFGVDSAGNLVVNGYSVCGWPDYTVDANGDYKFDTEVAVEPLNLFADGKKTLAPQVSTASTLSGSIDASATAQGTSTAPVDSTAVSTGNLSADSSTTLTVYDALGNSYNVQVKFYKSYVDTTTNNTSWYWEASTTDSNLTVTAGSGTIEFDSSGKIVASTIATTPTLTLTPKSGAAAFDVTLDMADMTSYANSGSDSLTNTTDGYSSGDLSDFSIGSDGVITGIYSNGQTQPLAMLALAGFTNPAGLLKIGDNLYSTTVNSGDFTGGVTAGSAGTGSLSAGTLEMSNVDLSEQFSEMMITQRAYQANSKIVSAADECLQAVINMVS